MDGEMGPHWGVWRESELDMRLIQSRALSGASLYLGISMCILIGSTIGSY